MLRLFFVWMVILSITSPAYAQQYDDAVPARLIMPIFNDVELIKAEQLEKYDASPKAVKDAELQFRIAVSYHLGTQTENGDLFNPDIKKATIWYKRAIEKEHAKSMVALSGIYMKKNSISKAVRLLSAAVKVKENIEPFAFYQMGQVYEQGVGRFINIEKALELYIKAADLDVINAMVKLAQWYEAGYNVERDYMKAIELYGRISEVTTDVSLKRDLSVKIAEMYGVVAYDNSGEEKFKWLLQAAEAGNVPSYIRIARAYQDGEGIQRNMEKAIDWYKKAAKGGDLYAKISLGYIYSNGLHDVEEDMCGAMDWYLNAAESGSADGAWNIGNFYLNGYCKDADQEVAKLWFSKAETLTNAK